MPERGLSLSLSLPEARESRHNVRESSLVRSGLVRLRLGGLRFLLRPYTEPGIKACTWLGEISSCSCLTVLPGPAWLLLNKIYMSLFWALYRLN